MTSNRRQKREGSSTRKLRQERDGHAGERAGSKKGVGKPGKKEREAASDGKDDRERGGPLRGARGDGRAVNKGTGRVQRAVESPQEAYSR